MAYQVIETAEPVKVLCHNCGHEWLIRNKQIGKRRCPLCRGVVYISEFPEPQSRVVLSDDPKYNKRHVAEIKQLDWGDIVNDPEFDDWWQGTFKQEKMGVDPVRSVEAYLEWRDKRRHIDD